LYHIFFTGGAAQGLNFLTGAGILFYTDISEAINLTQETCKALRRIIKPHIGGGHIERAPAREFYRCLMDEARCAALTEARPGEAPV
jgi:hypothetical protein